MVRQKQRRSHRFGEIGLTRTTISDFHRIKRSEQHLSGLATPHSEGGQVGRYHEVKVIQV